MGIVYRATDLSLDRPVALKLISSDLSGNPGFRRRFAEESRIAASLDHPNVIPIFHAGEHAGVLYLAMRFVEGDDLAQEIDEHGRLAPERAVALLMQVSSALEAAHSRGLVHRDVKPANIMLSHGDHAYLTDFGLSKRLIADSDVTVTGNLLGSLDYVAPEQIRGGEVGPQTDVYALGCVLFHSLAGQPPFAGLEREAKLWAHVWEPPPSMGPEAPVALAAVIARAMAKEPEQRFGSASDFADAAAEALAGAPDTTAMSTPKVDRSRIRARYRRALVAHALRTPFNLAVLIGTLLAGLVFGVVIYALPLGLAIYAAAVAVTCRDPEVQLAVAEGRTPALLGEALTRREQK